MYNIRYLTIVSSEPESCQYNIKQDSLSVSMPYMYFAYYSCVALFLLFIYLKLVSQPVQQQDYNTILICQDEEQKGRDSN